MSKPRHSKEEHDVRIFGRIAKVGRLLIGEDGQFIWTDWCFEPWPDDWEFDFREPLTSRELLHAMIIEDQRKAGK